MSDGYEIRANLANYHTDTWNSSIELGHYGGWDPVYHVLHFGPRTVRDITKTAKKLTGYLNKKLTMMYPYRSKADVHEFIHESLEAFFWPEKFANGWNPPKLTRTGRASNFDLYDVLETRQKHMTLPSFEYPSSKPYQQRPIRHWGIQHERGKNHLRLRKSDGRIRNYSYEKIVGSYFVSEKQHICSPLEGIKGNPKLGHEKERIIGIVVGQHGLSPQVIVHTGFYDPEQESYIVYGQKWTIEKITSPRQ